jgi:hypothetical protein
MGEQNIYGPNGPEPIGTFKSWEEYKGTTISISLDFLIRISFGYTSMSIRSVLPPMEMQSTSYPGVEQTDPLPRNLSLGINLNAGLVYKTEKGGFSLFSFNWAREVEDLLIRRLPDGTTEYVSGLHDIRFFRNVIRGKANNKVISKRGYELGFYDFYFVRMGKYEDFEGVVVYDTEGYGINYLQPVKIFASLLHLDDHFLVRLISNVSFEKNYSKYGPGSLLFNPEFTSYVIRLSSFPLN